MLIFYSFGGCCQKNCFDLGKIDFFYSFFKKRLFWRIFKYWRVIFQDCVFVIFVLVIYEDLCFLYICATWKFIIERVYNYCECELSYDFKIRIFIIVFKNDLRVLWLLRNGNRVKMF